MDFLTKFYSVTENTIRNYAPNVIFKDIVAQLLNLKVVKNFGIADFIIGNIPMHKIDVINCIDVLF